MAPIPEMDDGECILKAVKDVGRDINFAPSMEEGVEDMETDINSISLLDEIVNDVNRDVSFVPLEDGDGTKKEVNCIPSMEEGDIRRSSISGTIRGASSTPPRGEEKLLPNYLRASAGSCHDFCKYGHKHELEVKERRPFPRKVMRNIKVGKENETENHGESMKKPIFKSEATPELKAESSNKTKGTMRKTSAPKHSDTSDKHVIALKLTNMAVKSSDGASKLSSKANIANRKAASPAKNIEIPDKYVIPSRLKPPAAAKSPSSNSSKDLNGRRKGIDSPAHSSEGLYSGRNSDKPDYSGGLSARRNKEGKLPQSLLKEKKVTKPSILSLSRSASLKRISSLKRTKYRSMKVESAVVNQNKVHKSESNAEKVREKPLQVVKPKPENKAIKILRQRSRNSPLRPSSPASSKDSFLSSDKGSRGQKSVLSRAYNSIYKRADSEKKKLLEISISFGKRMLKRTPSVHRSEVKESLPEKLKFRRGKVVNVEPENNAPRRLKFRKVRSLRDNNKGEVGRRSFRWRREFGGNDGKPESHTIRLRHRDVQGKKEQKGLFNDVIEETANKLVETRKSKVQALVGAFETVISLQERKSAVPIANASTPTT